MLSLWFTSPHHLELRESPTPPPGPGQVRVASLSSAISSGTEMLVYRGQFPKGLAVDETIAALGGEFAYPMQYGYAVVGLVEALGAGVDAAWLGRRVFAFQPHQSHFVCAPEELLPLPDDLAPEAAVFLPNMETAVNFLLDGAPLMGEQAAVFGQGIVGLLTTALLARCPLARLVTLDRLALRRQWSLHLGAHASLDPAAPEAAARLSQALDSGGGYAGADLVFELSGAPAALDQAIQAAGFSGRIIVGSWYGDKRAALNLGGRFHRARLRLISSQVSTLTPELQARWSKGRRLSVAWQRLRDVQPERLITHRFPLSAAAQAYEQIDQRPEETLQVLLEYIQGP